MAVVDGWEATLDETFTRMCDNPDCAIPGLVVVARRGRHTYHKAFGHGGNPAVASGRMTLDAQFRCFSMTKVLTSAVALMLEEKGVLDLEANVGDYIPSFNRLWTVVESASDASKDDTSQIAYTSFLTGRTTSLSYRERPASGPMKVKHLMAESSGIGYDQWTDMDLWMDKVDEPVFGLQYGVAQSLRQRNGKGYYSSNCIIGQDATLAEYCDAIADAGVLVSDPGTFSYGLGALVLGRVIEVAFGRLEEKACLRFSDIMNEMLFSPLNMDSAAFYLDDGDPRIDKVPILFGGVLRDPYDFSGSKGCDVKPYADCLPNVSGLPNTVETDNFKGPRKCDSGDTGATMMASDYSKFYEFLLRGGTTEDGSRLLSASSVRKLTHGLNDGVNRASPIGKAFQLDDEKVASFNFGWARSPATSNSPHCNYWSGYANNHGRLYVDDDSYFCVFPQFMGSSTGGWTLGKTTVAEKATSAFLSVWA